MPRWRRPRRTSRPEHRRAGSRSAGTGPGESTPLLPQSSGRVRVDRHCCLLRRYWLRSNGNLQQRPGNAATEVGGDHSRFELEFVRQIALLACERCLEALAGDPRSKVKRSAPSVLIEVGSQIIVENNDLFVVAFFILRSAALGQPEAFFIFPDSRNGTGGALFVLQDFGELERHRTVVTSVAEGLPLFHVMGRPAPCQL